MKTSESFHAETDNPTLYKVANNDVFGRFFRLSGGISYCGIDNLKSIDDRPFILAPAHRSWYDPAVIAHTLLGATEAHVHFMAKKEIWEWPKPTGWFVSQTGAFPVDRSSKILDTKTQKHIDELVEHNAILGIFPEGTVTHGNRIDSIKTGVGRIALSHALPIIPVGISGVGKTDKKGWWELKRHIHVEYGAPIITPNIDDAVSKRDKVALIRTMTETIQVGMQDAQDLAVEHRKSATHR